MTGRLTSFSRLVTILFGLASAIPGFAAVYCVDSIAEIDAAMALASDQAVELRVVTGTYNIADSCLDGSGSCAELDEPVAILGGYAPGCGSRSLDARETVFIHQGDHRVFYMHLANGFEGGGDFVLSGLTLRGLLDGVFITVEDRFTGSHDVTLERVWFDRCGTVDLSAQSRLSMRQVLISDPIGNSFGNSLAINSSGYLEQVDISHLTVVGSSGGGVKINNHYGDARISINNSVFWDNVGDDLIIGDEDDDFSEITTTNASLIANTYSSLSVSRPLLVAPVETLALDPLFVDPANDNWELGGGSSAVNSGRLLAQSFSEVDLFGDARLFSNRPDRGALETTIGSTATTLVVSNSNDSGLGSLRQAILDANASADFNRIVFAIGGSCGPRVINLSSALPDITAPLHIDGYTQTGASRNTAGIGNNGQLCIILNGQGLGSVAGGLIVPGSVAEGVSVRVEGIAFGGFLISALTFSGGSDHGVFGVQIGGDVDAIDLLPSGYGIRVGYRMSGVTIGGASPGERNTIGETTIAAIQLAGSGSNQPSFARIQNNYIGVAPNGVSDLANERGIVIRSDNHSIIGNVIANSVQSGIEISEVGGHHNFVQGNRIGLPAYCFISCASAGNGSHGVLIHNGAYGNLISGNQIADNGGDGIAVIAAADNQLVGNSMSDNAGEGIDLGNDGITGNDNDYDPPPAQAGNRNQNRPLLTAAHGDAERGRVSGSLSSTNGFYRIDFYADDSCATFIGVYLPGQGRRHLGSVGITVSGGGSSNGSGSFSEVPIVPTDSSAFFATPRYIVATATRIAGVDANGFIASTSEFSSCRPYQIDDGMFADGFE